MSVIHQIELLKSGIMFDFDDPTPDMVKIDDIALALGNTCRWGGHTSPYLSVAEHAIAVARYLQECEQPADVIYAGLHHDSHEAYVGDIPTPLKHKLGETYRDLIVPIDNAIAEALDIDVELFHHPAVVAADQLQLAYEAAKLKPSGRAQSHDGWVEIDPKLVPPWSVQHWTPYDAAIEFFEADIRLRNNDHALTA